MSYIAEWNTGEPTKDGWYIVWVEFKYGYAGVSNQYMHSMNIARYNKGCGWNYFGVLCYGDGKVVKWTPMPAAPNDKEYHQVSLDEIMTDED